MQSFEIFWRKPKKRPFCKHRCCCRYFCAVAQIRCQSAVVADVWLCQLWLDPNSLLIPNSFYTFLLAFNYSATLRLSRQSTPITAAKVMSTSWAQRKEANCDHNLLRWCQCGVEPIQTKAKAKGSCQKLLSGFCPLRGYPPHIGPTLAPEAILFESPYRAHSGT